MAERGDSSDDSDEDNSPDELPDIQDLNFLEEVLHDDLAYTFKQIINSRGKLTAQDFDNVLPRLTARLGLDTDLEDELDDESYKLTDNDLKILILVLTPGHLSRLKDNFKGLDIEHAKSGQIMKKEVADALEAIGEKQLASALRYKGGIQKIQHEIYQTVYINALKDPKGFTVKLQPLKIIFCGVPRSGKSTFWRRLVKDDFDTEKLSQSTCAAEYHYIYVSVKSAMLYNWRLCSEDDSSSSMDLDKEALMIYKRILDAHESMPSQEAVQPSSVAQVSVSKQRTLTGHSEIVKDNLTGESESNNDSKIYGTIDSIFDHLRERLTNADPDDMLDITTICQIFSLADTGGQRAFLELLPVLTIGTALYLVFFSYGNPLNAILRDQYQGPVKAIDLNNQYTQIEVILQTLTCVSTKSFAADATLMRPKEQKDAKDPAVTAILVGTHTDQPSDQPGIDGDIDKYIQSRVKNFLDSEENVLERIDKNELVLKVNNKTEDNDEFKKYRKVLMDIVNRKFSDKTKELSGSWLMFSIILRKMKVAGWSVLPYQHCEYIASKLYIPPAALDALLYFMHKDLGILMYFPEVPCLRDVVICDPAVVLTSISEVIIKTFIEDVINKSKDGITESLQFEKYAVFAYQKVDELTKERRGGLELSKLTVLLQHVGIIAPIEFSKHVDPPFKCTLDHNHEEDAVHCIHSEYIIPCVLNDALDEKLAEIEEHCTNTNYCSMIAPLIITFQCNFAPMGSFCYLFTKLINDQTINWKPHLPDINSPNDCPTPIERMICRNKVTFIVDKKFYVTLVSTTNCFKVFIQRPEGTTQPGYEFVCYEVKEAIKRALFSCLNPQVKNFQIAFRCTGHPKKYEHNGHLMVFDRHIKNSMNLCARCEQNDTEVNVDTSDHAIRIWFQGPFKLVREPLNDQCKSFGDEIKLKVFIHPGTDCNYQWKKIGKKLKPDSNCSRFDSNMLEIKHFCKAYEGAYICTITDSKNEDYSESLSVILKFDAPKEFDIEMDDDDFYGYLSEQGLSLKDIVVLQENEIVAESFSIESVPEGISLGGKRKLNQVLKDNLKPKISVQPKSLRKYCGEEAVFMVTAEGADTITYQWLKDGNSIIEDDKHEGARKHTLTINSLQSKHAGSYMCIVENEHGRTESEAVGLNLKVKVTDQPLSVNKTFGEEAVIQVSATGQEPLKYQWRKAGEKGNYIISDSDNYFGTASNRLTVKSLTEELQGDYYCVVSNDVDQEESVKASLTMQRIQDSENNNISARKPNLHELDLIEGNDKTIRVINKIAYRWEQVATRLYFEGNDIERIRRNTNHQTEHACRAMFTEWLEGRGRAQITWETIISALKEAEFSEVANDLEQILGKP